MAQPPALQASDETLPTQSLEHLLPQAPQLLTSLVRFTSQPSVYWPSQSEKPALQAATTQVELEHAAVPFATEHRWLHVPQLFTFEVVFVSQPSPGLAVAVGEAGVAARDRAGPGRAARRAVRDRADVAAGCRSCSGSSEC